MTRALWACGCLFMLGASSTALGAPVPKPDAKTVVTTYFTNLEQGGFGDTAPLRAVPDKDLIHELGKYLGDGSEERQRRAVWLIGSTGWQSNDKEARTLAVQLLLNHATADKPDTRKALEYLLKYSQADFPEKADKQIEKLVRVKNPQEEAFLLAGFLEVRSVIDDLKERTKVNHENPFSPEMWYAHLALARMGNADSVKHCTDAVDGEKDLAQRVRHFEELLFTRHPDAMKLLTKYLMSDERLSGVKVNDPGTKVSQYVLYLFAENIEDFPIKSARGASYTEEQLAAARKWVKEQKELKPKR